MILMLVLCVTGCDSIKTAMKDILGKPGETESGAMRALTASEFYDFTQQSGKLVVVYFHADWCPQCKRLGPMLDKLAVEYADRMVVGTINIDKCGVLAAKHGVEGIPDVRLYLYGQQVDKQVGLPPEQALRSLLEKHMPVFVKQKEASTKTGEGQNEQEKPEEPSIQPMNKDWMPPGMERK